MPQHKYAHGLLRIGSQKKSDVTIGLKEGEETVNAEG